MNAFLFAWRSLVRQPARALLGILGVAAVGALLFDMLMLSNGLVRSMETMLGKSGFSVRVAASDSPLLGVGPLVTGALATAAAIGALPEVAATVPVRYADAEVPRPLGAPALRVRVMGAGDSTRPLWTMREGTPLRSGDPGGTMLINRNLATRLRRTLGEVVPLHAFCGGGVTAAPAMALRLTGIADFDFEEPGDAAAAITLQDFDRACGGEGRDQAEQILVATTAGTSDTAARAAIERLRPDLHAFSNSQLVARLQQGGLSYFQQISLVLTTVTISFAFLLVTVLLTVSVNQRVGEIAALRALGLSQSRVIADILWSSVLLVGSGALLAIPVGFALARVLDGILKAIPGVPDALHFFVYEPRALWIHAALFTGTALLAAAYPMRLVATLPIAGTLRKEVVG